MTLTLNKNCKDAKFIYKIILFSIFSGWEDKINKDWDYKIGKYRNKKEITLI